MMMMAMVHSTSGYAHGLDHQTKTTVLNRMHSNPRARNRFCERCHRSVPSFSTSILPLGQQWGSRLNHENQLLQPIHPDFPSQTMQDHEIHSTPSNLLLMPLAIFHSAFISSLSLLDWTQYIYICTLTLWKKSMRALRLSFLCPTFPPLMMAWNNPPTQGSGPYLRFCPSLSG